ncbi:MAG TPA: glycosyltransferase 87 family protein [Candidatus Binatia bacterium]|nr:glycosyltransferase 87 family protein [Candidatus Binatia bacterium]
MTRLLDLVAQRSGFLNRLGIGVGILFVGYYWLILTQTLGLPVDMRWYWEADPSNLYPHPELLQQNGYNYSPAFELVVGWGRLVPFEVFVAIWRAILCLALLWLAGPAAAFVLFLVPVASEINAGNIQLLLAAAIVLAFRGGDDEARRDGRDARDGPFGRRRRRWWEGSWWPATSSFVLLTKVTPGVGLLWFALRRQWRALGVAVGVTAVIAAVTFAIWPERWFGWFALMTAGSPPPVPPFNLPFWPRFVAAVVIVVLAAWRGWRWPVVVAGCLALPAFYTISPSMLVGVLPFARAATGRWAERRRDAANHRRAAAAGLAIPAPQSAG